MLASVRYSDSAGRLDKVRSQITGRSFVHPALRLTLAGVGFVDSTLCKQGPLELVKNDERIQMG